VAAPYHRLSAGIMASHDLFTSAPDEARRIAARLGVAYVLTCGGRAPKDVASARLDTSLWTKLKAGETPSWLARVELADSPFVAFRVVR
jgi:hypothetical protein